jgi:hypothetical protein
MNQVSNSKIPPSGHLIFFSTNIRNENKTREIQKWPRSDRTSLIPYVVFFFFFLIQMKHYQIRSNRVCEPHRRVQIKQHNNYNSTYTMSDVVDQHSASPAKRYGFRVSRGAQHVKRGAAGSCSTIGC